MDNQIKKLLNELYQIEPSLKEKEKQLINILNTLLQIKPEIKISPDFVRNLKIKLMDKIENKKTLNWKFILSLGGTMAAISLLTIFSYKFILPDNQARKYALALNTSFKINKLPANSLGRFEIGNNQKESLSGREVALDSNETTSSKTRSFATGNGGTATTSAMPIADSKMVTTGDLGGPNDIAIMPPYYNPIPYKFVFSEKLPILETQMEVLKKVNNSQNALAFGKILKETNLGLINLQNISNLGVRYITFFEDKEEGYEFSLNLEAGTLSINRNYSKWVEPQTFKALEKSDIPADAELIRIAKNFIENYEIDLSAYGEPIVDKSWERYYSPENNYISSQQTVIFPLKYKNNLLIDNSGNITGMRVSINIISQRVDSVWDISVNQYDSSNYEIASSEEILKAIEGYSNYYYYGDDGRENSKAEKKNLEVNLKEPELVYLRQSLYIDNAYTEVIMPAFKFKVEKEIANYNLPENLIIPVAKEFINQNNYYGIMPMIEKGGVMIK